MEKILIAYSTTDGHTKKICKTLIQHFESNAKQTTLTPITELASSELEKFDTIIIGASIRYGKHHKSVYKFIKQNSDRLNQMNSAFFSVNLVARKPEKRSPKTNIYFKKFMDQIPWQPKHLAVFGGRLNYPKYNFIDRIMIQLIMTITKGPTDPKTDMIFTDWNEVENYGNQIIG